jgi:regulator of chromosome condensation
VGGIETIAAGGMHNVAIDQKGQVRTWGINDGASLGRVTGKDEDLQYRPFVVEELVKAGFRAVKVCAGDSVSVAISDKGDLRVWGSFRVSTRVFLG